MTVNHTRDRSCYCKINNINVLKILSRYFTPELKLQLQAAAPELIILNETELHHRYKLPPV